MGTRTVRTELTRPSLPAAVSPRRAGCAVGQSGVQAELPLGGEIKGWGGRWESTRSDGDASLQCTTTRVMSGSSCVETASASPSTLSATTMMTVATAQTSPRSVVSVPGPGGQQGPYLL